MAGKPASGTPGAPDRQARRKQRTRGRLLSAANSVFLEKGVDGVSVTDITEAADLAHGTFYNYFDSVGSVATAIVAEVLKEIDAHIGSAPAVAADPVLQVAIGTRRLFRAVVSEPALQWLAERPDLVASIIFDSIAASAFQDVAAGVRSGHFNLPGDPAMAKDFSVWGFTGAMQRLARTPSEVDAVTEEATLVLMRVLGVADRTAQRAVAAARVAPG
ncbi:MAG: TetR/AcrR family transcriptional regulator [Pseudomonadota bacterium]